MPRRWWLREPEVDRGGEELGPRGFAGNGAKHFVTGSGRGPPREAPGTGAQQSTWGNLLNLITGCSPTAAVPRGKKTAWTLGRFTEGPPSVISKVEMLSGTGGGLGFGVRLTWVQIPALPFPTHVTLDASCDLAVCEAVACEVSGAAPGASQVFGKGELLILKCSPCETNARNGGPEGQRWGVSPEPQLPHGRAASAELVWDAAPGIWRTRGPRRWVPTSVGFSGPPCRVRASECQQHLLRHVLREPEALLAVGFGRLGSAPPAAWAAEGRGQRPQALGCGGGGARASAPPLGLWSSSSSLSASACFPPRLFLLWFPLLVLEQTSDLLSRPRSLME